MVQLVVKEVSDIVRVSTSRRVVEVLSVVRVDETNVLDLVVRSVLTSVLVVELVLVDVDVYVDVGTYVFVLVIEIVLVSVI